MTVFGASDDCDPEWRFGAVQLKLQFGDLTLGRFVLALFSREAALTAAPLRIGEVPLGPGVSRRCDGFVLWSCPLAMEFPKISKRNGVLVYVPRQYPRYTADLSGNFDDYLRKFSPKTRSTLKRKVKKFGELSGGTVDFREYHSPADLDVFWPLATRVSRATYHERLFDSGLPDDPAFIAAAKESAAIGEVRAYLLFLGGVPVSYLYCPRRAGVLSYSYVGYDPMHAGASPGIVLQFLALKALFAERSHKLFDFTAGEGQHKRLFATTQQLCGDVYVLRPGARPIISILAQLSIDRISAILGRVAERAGLKSRLRRMIRSFPV